MRRHILSRPRVYPADAVRAEAAVGCAGDEIQVPGVAGCLHERPVALRGHLRAMGDPLGRFVFAGQPADYEPRGRLRGGSGPSRERAAK